MFREYNYGKVVVCSGCVLDGLVIMITFWKVMKVSEEEELSSVR